MKKILLLSIAVTIFTFARAADENLSIIISDLHLENGNHSIALFDQTIEQILALNPRPKRIVCLGDLGGLSGRTEEYPPAVTGLKRLRDAGFDVITTLGNHDRAQNWAQASSGAFPVPSDNPTIVSLGACDLLLVDSHQEDPADGSRGMEGDIPGARRDGLLRAIEAQKRPFLIAAHHPLFELASPATRHAIGDTMLANTNCLGWIHGHDHAWKTRLIGPSRPRYNDNNLRRMLGVPSVSCWGDIGFVLLRTAPGVARAELVLNEHLYPNRLIPKTWIDREIENELRGSVCTFRW